MGKALYRKYRSKSLGEIIGQEHITSTLQKALKSGRISHAYLFSGPRGVGKTSIARILAHEINELPYTDDANHLDIIEIDAASNRRIDEIRELRDKVYIAPTSGKFKVYIIDEVHMLTREAFNALLKTLEEPPAHAVFILATTEAHKLPDTIISRTQHYTFKPVEKDKVIEHLAGIAKKEKITITADALALLAAHGGGSFRDSISLLDQAGSIEGSIDEPHVRQLLGIASDEAIDTLLQLLQNGNHAGELLATINDLYSSGLQAANIANQLAAKLRSGLVAGKPVLPIGKTLLILRELLEVPASHNPERLLEITLLESASTTSIAAAPDPIAAPSQSKKSDEPTTVTPPRAKEADVPIQTSQAKPETPQPAPDKPESSDLKEVAAPPADIAPEIVRAFNETVWPEVLGSIKKQYNTLYGVLRMAQPVFGEDTVELQFTFAFHQKRINEVKNRKIVADFIKQVTGQNIVVTCTVNKAAVPGPVAGTSAAAVPAASSPALESISNIFGGGEVL